MKFNDERLIYADSSEEAEQKECKNAYGRPGNGGRGSKRRTGGELKVAEGVVDSYLY